MDADAAARLAALEAAVGEIGRAIRLSGGPDVAATLRDLAERFAARVDEDVAKEVMCLDIAMRLQDLAEAMSED